MKTILVIDDEASLRKALAATLQRGGYAVLDTGLGAEGLSLALAHHPDLILSDINLPGLNGLDVLKALRGRPAIAAIPVILMTGEMHKTDARASMTAGADDFLPKPFSMEQMLATVRARLERQNAIQQTLDTQNQSERTRTAGKIRLQTTALQAAANGIAITDRSGKICWINPAFTKLTGYTFEEALGQTPRLLNSGQQPPSFYEEMWATILAGKVWHGDLVNKRKDGTLYFEEMTITPVRGTNGEIENFIAIKQDVTERKQVEQALAHESELLQALMDNLPDHIYFKDPHSRFTRINHAMARLLGLRDPQAAMGRSDVDFFPLADARQKQEDEARLLATGKPILDLVEKSETESGVKWVSSTKVPIYDQGGRISGLVGISRDITERKRMEESLHKSEEKFRNLFELSRDALMVGELPTGRFIAGNAATVKLFGLKNEQEFTSLSPMDLSPERQPDGRASGEKAGEMVEKAMREGSHFFEWKHRRAGGQEFFADVLLTRLERDGKPVLLATVRDITERKRAELERQRMEMQLRQAQKLESIGQLAAGIAHEINTPTQYVGDNTRFLKDSFAAILNLLQSHQAVLAAAKAGALTPEVLRQSEELLATSDLEYLRRQIPQALDETLEGIERVSKIVRAMKDFSHPGGKDKAPADLNKAIESTVTVARNEWKYVADLKLELDPDLPFVPCFLGEFNQAVLNLLVNAAHAIEDVVKTTPGTKGLITVQTRRHGDRVEVRVADNGTGIPEAARSRIFEPFFTTKAVGKGTGQGLAMIYGSIVNRHNGAITFETEVGKGTTFILDLPLNATAKPVNVSA